MNTIVFTVLVTGVMVSQAVPAQAIGLKYESVFKDYQPHKEVKLKDWKTSNEEVRAAGGFRAYLRESSAPEPNKADMMDKKSDAAMPNAASKSIHEGHQK